MSTSELFWAQRMVKGKIYETDSTTSMPFVFIINKGSGNGTVSDNEGRFSITMNTQDTLICTFVGFAKSIVPVASLKPDANGEVKIFLQQMPINLSAITVSAFKIKPYERDYMNDIIDRSRTRTISGFNSPISALYMKYSKEGKQVRKLAQIFEGLLIEEQVQQKLSPEILRRLTGDDGIDYAMFRKYCYSLSNEYIVNHDGFELYTKVMDCYRRWKNEGH